MLNKPKVRTGCIVPSPITQPSTRKSVGIEEFAIHNLLKNAGKCFSNIKRIFLTFHVAVHIHVKVLFHIYSCHKPNALGTDQADFIKIFIQVTNDFFKQQCLKHIIEKANDKVQSISQDIILKPYSKKDSINCTTLIRPFHSIPFTCYVTSF